MQDNTRFYETLTPENSALILIDHQVGLLSTVKTLPTNILKNNIIALAETAKLFNIPVILTSSKSSGPNGEFLKEITEMFPDVQVIDRTIINAWEDQNFLRKVKATGRSKLIMAGIVTDVCLTLPAISAVRDGYDVYATIDASGTWCPLVEQSAISRLAQAGVKTTNWFAISSELQKDWNLPTGQKLGQLYYNHIAAYEYMVDSSKTKEMIFS